MSTLQLAERTHQLEDPYPALPFCKNTEGNQLKRFLNLSSLIIFTQSGTQTIDFSWLTNKLR
jgi:hypothetical protein